MEYHLHAKLHIGIIKLCKISAFGKINFYVLSLLYKFAIARERGYVKN